MKAGARLRSAVCATTVVVVKPGDGDGDVECGGVAMLEGAGDAGSGDLADGFDQGTQLGKRYWDEVSGLELLCTKAGNGSLSVGGRPLELKAAKALPASD